MAEKSVQKISKPQLRGLLGSSMKFHLPAALALSAVATVWFKYSMWMHGKLNMRNSTRIMMQRKILKGRESLVLSRVVDLLISQL
jgi:hypothetical protein